MDNDVFIKLNHVSKTFPGVKALENICLEVKRGEVHALVGENGAGKSTLIKILAGIYQPDPDSEITLDGEKCSSLDPITSLKKGIVVIYQDFSLFPNLTVAENIAISSQIEKGNKTIHWKELHRTAEDALRMLGVDIDLNVALENLSTARQQLVAIARALACKAKLIIMDEPTSTLSKSEVELLFKIIRNLQQQGISILFVSHKLEELFEVCSIYTIIRDGKYIGTYQKGEIDNDKLISLMVGRKIETVHQGSQKIGREIFSVSKLCKKGNFKDISFQLHEGEIIGITGLVGAGRTEVAQAIFGISPPDSGVIEIGGKALTVRDTEDAVKYGLAFVPENRLTEGLILRQSVESNIAVTILKALRSRTRLIDPKKKAQQAVGWIQKLEIKPSYPDMTVQKLSGGNQQRVVIAKWLATNPKVLIIDEPTNGIDIGAKAEIHTLLRQLATQGMGIIMISSELPEVLAISDTVLVMRSGRITASFDGGSVTQEQIMNAAILAKSSEKSA